MASATVIVSIVLGLVAVVYLVVYLLSRPRNAGRAPLPPGPKGLPILGNLNDLPKPGVLEAHHWLKHKDLYGSCKTDPPQSLVASSAASIHERGAIYKVLNIARCRPD